MRKASELFKNLKLTKQQKNIIDIAGKIGREKLAPRAEKIDREAINPMDNYDNLRKCGIHWMCVPERFGGLGHNYAAYMMVSSELGRHCGATALSFNMHASTTLWIGDMVDKLDLEKGKKQEMENLRRIHYQNIVNDGALYAQTFSEGNTAAAGKKPFSTTVKKVNGGWILNGRKIFASLSGAATHYGILCTEEKPELSALDTMYFAVPTNSKGFSLSLIHI